MSTSGSFVVSFESNMVVATNEVRELPFKKFSSALLFAKRLIERTIVGIEISSMDVYSQQDPNYFEFLFEDTDT